MQMSVPDAMDIRKEPQHILDLYGAVPGYKSRADEAADPRRSYSTADASFANNCLLARRLVERGVRFVQLFDWGWDAHGTGKHDDIVHQLPKKCRETDQPLAALIRDLKQRGMLQDTLVVWGGEFGRTSMNEKRNGSKFLGRDHHPRCFTLWMAGGGVKKGFSYGETDELGYNIARDPVHVHDFQATLMHLLGVDHERLTFKHQGRRFRLTDVHGKVVHELLG